jgi:cell wall-associated NlpC family hydrolase
MLKALSPARNRRTISLAAVGALGASLFLAAPSASASPGAAPSNATPTAQAPTSASKLAVRTSKRTYVQGKKGTRIVVQVRAGDRAATGKVRVYAGKKSLRTTTLRNGKAAIRLPKNLKAKRHTITVRYFPRGAVQAAPATKKFQVRVKDRRAAVVRIAKKFVGSRYRIGGASPRTGFDCSGFTSYVYGKAGKKLPKSSSAQRHVGKVVSRSKAKPGDLIWSPGHVAIYLGGNKQIDSPRPGKSIKVRSIWQHNPTFIRV